jgi:hypothetical protein
MIFDRVFCTYNPPDDICLFQKDCFPFTVINSAFGKRLAVCKIKLFELDQFIHRSTLANPDHPKYIFDALVEHGRLNRHSLVSNCKIKSLNSECQETHMTRYKAFVWMGREVPICEPSQWAWLMTLECKHFQCCFSRNGFLSCRFHPCLTSYK